VASTCTQIKDAGVAQLPASALPLASVCSVDGFCWHRPLPQGNSLLAFWSAAANDVWAVGGRGTAIHFDGTSWSGKTGLVGVAGGFVAVHGSSPSNVWMAGENGALAGWDGSSFKVAPLDAGIFTVVRALGPSDVYVCANSLMHWDGSSLTVVAATQNVGCVDLWAATSKDLWLNSGGDQRWNGSKWSSVPYPAAATHLAGLWGSGSNDIWQLATNADKNLVLRWTGSWATAFETTVALWHITGSGPDDVWLQGVNGELLHASDGHSFTAVDSGVHDKPLAALCAPAAGQAWATTVGTTSGGISDSGGGSLYRWNGSAFARYSDAPIDARATAVWAVAPDDVWMAFSDASLMHFDGMGWTGTTLDGAPTLAALWGSSANDLWAGGSNGSLLHFDGACWQRSPSPRSANVISLSGSATDDVWAVDQNGEALHWNGQAWYASQQGSLPGAPSRVVSLSKNEIWFETDQGIARGDGRSWSLISDAPPRASHMIAGGPNAILVLGAAPGDAGNTQGVWRWDGRAWSFVPVTNSTGLTQFFGLAADDLWIVADGGAAWHWDGHALNDIVFGAGPRATVLGASQPGELWVGGEQGMILHRAAR
jgi:hypothetical protein